MLRKPVRVAILNFCIPILKLKKLELIRFSKKFWKSIIWATIIFIVCTMPSDGVSRFKLFQIPYFDKWIHLMFYLVLGAILFYEINANRGSNANPF
jgi:hypothetical protein